MASFVRKVLSRRLISSCVAVTIGASLPWVAGAGAAWGAEGGSEPGGGLSAALGSLGGAVDERTAQVRFAPSLGGVSGPAGSGLALKAQFSQQLASAGVDRYGLGAGMTLGLPFIDVARGALVLPSGEHELDDSSESGLKKYKLKDVKLSVRTGDTPVPHAFVLESFKDGTQQFFDKEGDLAAVQDRFGHLTKPTWKVVNGQHRLESVTGGWGAKLTVAYQGSKVVFSSPKRWGQAKAPQTTVALTQGRIESVTDAAGETTQVEWRPEGTDRLFVPSAIVSPSGARTEFDYAQAEARSGGVLHVASFEVKNADGDALLAPVAVSIDPTGDNAGRNYTGCPEYCADGTDRLENSGDGSFSYTVRFSQQNGQEVERNYNALHLQKSEVLRVKHGSQTKEISRTEFDHPGETAEGAPPKLQEAPGDFQMPSKVKVTAVDPADSARTKQSDAVTEYDTLGRQTRQVQNGVETVTEYGSHSLPIRTETKDSASGTRQVTESTLTADGNAVAKVVTKAAVKDGEDLRTVGTSVFEYHDGELAGELAKTTVTGDEKADGGDPGPAASATRTEIDRDQEGVGRRTNAVTGADGVTTTTVSDLAGGTTLSTQTGDLAPSTAEYDIADRTVKTTSPDGSVTTIAYETHKGGSSVTDRQEAKGFAARTTSDELGRTTSTETNYQPSADGGRGAILPDGQWRQTSAAEYDSAGQQVKSVDAGNRTTTVEHDAWGRPEKTSSPDGSSTLHSHDDVAGTQKKAIFPEGADKPMVTTTSTTDVQGNPVKQETAYGDGTPGAVAQATFDGLGRAVDTRDGSSPYLSRTTYDHAGNPKTNTLVPEQQGTAAEAQAVYETDAFGNKTRKTLSSQGASVSGFETRFDAAGRSAEVAQPGDGPSSTTHFNAVNGLVDSVVLPDGSVAHQRADDAGRTVESWVSPKGRAGDREQHVRASYDPATGMVAARWFADDEAASKITYAYNPDGSLREQVDPGGKKTAFTYTDDGQTASVTDHTGAVTTFSYAPETGRLTESVQVRDGEELA
ncbi:hypothetical protein, partial [Streptomyces cyaneofuscatus]|uniref:hypothetical protein n=1 Tax=Streptomyces cyaneofuscatus TaxID=66883 RepID=UPI00380C7003